MSAMIRNKYVFLNRDITSRSKAETSVSLLICAYMWLRHEETFIWRDVCSHLMDERQIFSSVSVTTYCRGKNLDLQQLNTSPCSTTAHKPCRTLS